MTDSPDAPTPDDAPLSVGDDEVDRLLKEAESLTAEIAEDAGVDTKPSDPDAAPDPAGQATPGDLGDAPPDPLSAAAKAETAARGLSDLLQDAEAAAPPDDADEDEFAAPTTPQQNEDDFNGFATLTEDEHAAFDSATDGGGGGGGETPAPKEGEEEASDETEAVTPERLALIPRCRRSLESVTRSLRSVPTNIPAGVKAVIVWTDRPFAGLSLSLKRALGAIALASILTGIAAWVLPGALEHNPFADMPTGTAVDGALLQPPEK